MIEKITVSLDGKLLDAARKKSVRNRRSLDGYIAHLIARDIAGADGVVVSVTAPDDVREYVPVAFEGENADIVKQRDALMDALLTASGR